MSQRVPRGNILIFTSPFNIHWRQIYSFKSASQGRIFLLDCRHSTNSAKNSGLGTNLTFGPDESTLTWRCCIIVALSKRLALWVRSVNPLKADWTSRVKFDAKTFQIRDVANRGSRRCSPAHRGIWKSDLRILRGVCCCCYSIFCLNILQIFVAAWKDLTHQQIGVLILHIIGFWIHNTYYDTNMTLFLPLLLLQKSD